MLQINLLGKLSVQRDAYDVTLPLKAQELLGFLLLFPRHAHMREALAARLWGESTAKQAKKYLRQTLWHLQSLLGQETETGAAPLLLVEGDWVQVNAQAKLQVDTWSVKEAFKLIKDRPGEALAAEQVTLLKETVTRCQGELLPNWYHDWCLLEREQYRLMLFTILDKLVAYCLAHQQWESGIQYGMQLLQMDQSREKGHRHLMRLYYLSGDRTAALRQFQYCQRLLEIEFGVEPTHKTEQLWQLILKDQFHLDGNRQPPRTPTAPTAAARATQDDRLADLLKQLATELDTLRSDIKDIRYILEK
ncbi:MAG: BTAD domain-containing putative transcriptional regulator [Chloroflexota bacterium]